MNHYLATTPFDAADDGVASFERRATTGFPCCWSCCCGCCWKVWSLLFGFNCVLFTIPSSAFNARDFTPAESNGTWGKLRRCTAKCHHDKRKVPTYTGLECYNLIQKHLFRECRNVVNLHWSKGKQNVVTRTMFWSCMKSIF